MYMPAPPPLPRPPRPRAAVSSPCECALRAAARFMGRGGELRRPAQTPTLGRGGARCSRLCPFPTEPAEVRFACPHTKRRTMHALTHRRAHARARNALAPRAAKAAVKARRTPHALGPRPLARTHMHAQMKSKPVPEAGRGRAAPVPPARGARRRHTPFRAFAVGQTRRRRAGPGPSPPISCQPPGLSAQLASAPPS